MPTTYHDKGMNVGRGREGNRTIKQGCPGSITREQRAEGLLEQGLGFPPPDFIWEKQNMAQIRCATGLKPLNEDYIARTAVFKNDVGRTDDLNTGLSIHL